MADEPYSATRPTRWLAGVLAHLPLAEGDRGHPRGRVGVCNFCAQRNIAQAGLVPSAVLAWQHLGPNQAQAARRRASRGRPTTVSDR